MIDANNCCKNCRHWRRPSEFNMKKKSNNNLLGYCTYKVNGINIRGNTKPEGSCFDFEEGNNENNI